MAIVPSVAREEKIWLSLCPNAIDVFTYGLKPRRPFGAKAAYLCKRGCLRQQTSPKYNTFFHAKSFHDSATH